MNFNECSECHRLLDIHQQVMERVEVAQEMVNHNKRRLEYVRSVDHIPLITLLIVKNNLSLSSHNLGLYLYDADIAAENYINHINRAHPPT